MKWVPGQQSLKSVVEMPYISGALPAERDDWNEVFLE